MKTLETLLVVALTGMIAGCDITLGKAEEDEENERLASLEGVRIVTATINGESDTSYVSVLSNGNISVFDYQGDAVGTGNNCYTYATSPSQVNSMIHGATITAEYIDTIPEETPAYLETFVRGSDGYRYTITSHPNVGDFQIGFNSPEGDNAWRDQSFSSLNVASGLSVTDSTTGYNVSLSNETIYFTPSDTVFHEDLVSMLCD